MKPRANLLERKTPSGVLRVCSLCRQDMHAEQPDVRGRFREHVRKEHVEVTPRTRSAQQKRCADEPGKAAA